MYPEFEETSTSGSIDLASTCQLILFLSATVIEQIGLTALDPELIETIKKYYRILTRGQNTPNGAGNRKRVAQNSPSRDHQQHDCPEATAIGNGGACKLPKTTDVTLLPRDNSTPILDQLAANTDANSATAASVNGMNVVESLPKPRTPVGQVAHAWFLSQPDTHKQQLTASIKNSTAVLISCEQTVSVFCEVDTALDPEDGTIDMDVDGCSPTTLFVANSTSATVNHQHLHPTLLH
ncbi:unnamed protein product [Mesocestoides corti]|uniref:Uncharacterized protein n=1 Tax=Mesocestoides corti TaxID=53468 RepID=A0A0R3UN46_MESCO|nr:unnamed protein product [Mesocestoides corti]